MKTWLEQISIVALRHDGETVPIPETEGWLASRFDGDRKLVPKRDEQGNVLLNEDTQDPIYVINPEQLCSFRSSISIDLQSHADVDLAVVLIATVSTGTSIMSSATLQVPLAAHGTCTVELNAGAARLIQHRIQISAFEPSTVKTSL